MRDLEKDKNEFIINTNMPRRIIKVEMPKPGNCTHEKIQNQDDNLPQESDIKLMTILDSMGDSIHIIDREYTISLYNEAFKKWLNTLNLDCRISGQNVFDAFPFLPSQVRSEYEKVFEIGKTMLTQESVFIGDQELITETRKIPIIKEGKVTNVITVVRDITAQKTAEEALREERDRAKKYIDIAGVIFVALDINGKVTLINKRGCEILEYTEEEITGKSWFDNFIPEDTRKDLKSVFDKLTSGKLKHVEYHENTVISKRGGTKIIAWHNSILTDKSGKITGTLSSGEDITFKKESEEALRESEEKYRNLVERGNDGICIIQDTIMKYVNKQFAKILGYTVDNIIGNEFKNYVYPDNLDKIMKKYQAFMSNEEDEQISEIGLQHKDGHKVEVELNISVTPYNSRRAALVFVRDITERKKAEERAILQQQQIIQADKMASLGVLVSGVAHEINNPNNFITLNTQILMESWEDILSVLEEYHSVSDDFPMDNLKYEEIKKNIPSLLKGIMDGADRIKRIVNELKDFARKETSDLKEWIDINLVIKSAVSLISNQINTSTRHFSIQYDNNVPKIPGNFQRLEQVMINLIQNACQALPDKEKGIFVSTCYDEGNGIVIKIKDEGIGIPQEDIPRITDPFFTTKRNCGGTGLGLTVSLNIITDHGGRLKFESNYGQGTTAIVVLPVKRTDSSP